MTDDLPGLGFRERRGPLFLLAIAIGFAFFVNLGTPPLFDGAIPCPHFEDGEATCTQPDGYTQCTDTELHLCDGAAVELESKGWWSSRFDALIILYDPADLAAVAAGGPTFVLLTALFVCGL